MNIQFRVLGSLEVDVDGQALELGGEVDRRIVGALLLHPNQLVRLDRLTEAAWDDQPPPTARRQVQNRVGGIRSRFRRVGVDDLIIARPAGYQIRIDPEQLDALRFDRLVGQAAEQEQQDDLAGAADTLRQALDLWRGPVLADLEGDFLGRLAAARQEQRLTVVERRVDLDLALGRHRQVVAELRRLTAEYPLRERPVGQLMVALYRDGRRADALSAYQDLARRLSDNLGLDPGPGLRHRHEAVLRDDPALQAPGRAAVHGGSAGAARPSPAQLPVDVPAFAGRAEELSRLHDLLTASDDRPAAVVISALSGTAGVGKTALAVHFAHQVAARFPDGQLYANLHGFSAAGSARSPAEAIRMFLEALGVPPQKVPASLDGQVALYRSQLAGKRMLVLLDNARDADQVRPLLPGSGASLVVVTSRNHLTGLTVVEGARPLLVDLPTAGEARQLLAARLGHSRVAAEPDATAEIITSCARLPLALSIVAARAAAHPTFPLATLAKELRGAHGRLDALASDGTDTDVRAVFSWSYHALTHRAARLFRLLGLHPGPDIAVPAAASLAALPLPQVRALLGELAGANLIAEHTPRRYTFHDLLRAYAADLVHHLEPDEERQAATHRLLDHYLHTAHTADRLLYPARDPITLAAARAGVSPEHPADHEQALTWFTAEHPVLLAAVDHAADTGFDTHTWQLTWTLSTFLNRRGHWHDQIATGHAAVAAARRLADPLAQARAHRTIADAHTQLQRLDDAHIQLQHALALSIQVGDHAGQAYIHLTLGHLREQQGHHAEALDHARQALDLFEAAGHRSGQAFALNAVGWTHILLGNHQQALTACQRAHAMFEELGNRYGQAHTWDSLGYAHHHLGHHRQAVTCYEHALALYRDLADRHNEADTLIHLGDTYRTAGNPDAAGAAWQRALTILTDIGHPDAHAVRTNLYRLDHPDADT
jgi:DNA-binding SARP family transcriptional activator